MEKRWALVCAGVNVLAVPGLGSIMAGRRATGAIQMVLAIVGFALALAWCSKLIALYSHADEAPDLASLPYRLLIAGAVMFISGWLWSLASSLQILRETRKTNV